MSTVNRTKAIAAAHKYLAKGNLKKAIREYERVLRDDPSDIRTKLKVADLLFRLGDKDRSTAVFLEVARFYAGQGFLLKAVAVYKQVQRLKPEDVSVYLALAALYQQIGLTAEAVAQYREAIALLGRQGQTLERLRTAQKMLELDPDNARLRIELGEEFSKEGMIEEAVHEFRAAYEILNRAGLEEEAILVAERLLYHQPDDFEICKALAQRYIAQKDALKALTRLQVCYRLRPTDPEVLDLLAGVFEFLGQPQKAAAVLKALAREYDRSGLIRDRDEVFQRVLRLNPQDQSAAAALQYVPVPAVPLGQELVLDGHGESRGEILEAEKVHLDEEIPIDEMGEDTNPEVSAVEVIEEPEEPPPMAPPQRPALTVQASRPGEAPGSVPLVVREDSASVGMDALDQATVVEPVAPFLQGPGDGMDLASVPPELQDDVQNLEFLVDAGLYEEAATLLEDIRRRGGDLPILERYRILIEAGS
ncbi:MAG TPA: tetratricopeptide repeat protein [Myxococcota bacterium]|nr:tetratricopeptide repeat protein [Myxococcota bacterium]HQK51945.1 tetratricopeptide repeat protein [Myxococcota bacterium]